MEDYPGHFDRHSEVILVKSGTLENPANLLEVLWDSGVTEFVPDNELKEA